MAIPKNFEHALDLLPHLARCARERRTTTYQELGEIVGVLPWYMGGPLDVLRDQILPAHRLPRIDALVVNKETGEVGDSFYAGGRKELSDEDYKKLLDHEREKVFAFEDWDKIVLRLQRHYGGEDYLRRRKIAVEGS